MRDFIKKYLGPRFEEQGLDCEIWAGTIERGSYDAWVNTILRDEDAAKFIKGLGFQWAGKGCVQKTNVSWPDFPMVQTENECGDGLNTWGHAIHVFNLLWHYITNGVSAYVYWNMVLQPFGGSTWGWKQNAMVTVDPATLEVTYNPEFFVMKHFAGFVRPGAKVCRVTGSWAGNAVAFENTDGTKAVMICNPLQDDHTFVLDLDGEIVEAVLPAGSVNTFAVGA
jgi:glucosylceramidase